MWLSQRIHHIALKIDDGYGHWQKEEVMVLDDDEEAQP